MSARSSASCEGPASSASARLVPPTDRSTAGYRLYDLNALHRLDLVRTLRDLGVDLATIQRVLDREISIPEVAAAHADGWNHWGAGVERFGAQASNLAMAAARRPFTASWGGLVVLADDDVSAAAKADRLGAGDGVIVGGPDLVASALRAYADAGADWLMVGPIDAADPDNARILGEEILPRLR